MGERTRVTLYSDAAWYGGAEVYLSLLARHLDRNRFEVSALVPDLPPVERLEREFARCGVPCRRHRRLGFRWWGALGSLREDLHALAGDVLHVNLPSTYDAGMSSVALAGKLAGYRRVVATEHLPMIRRRYKRFPVKFLMGEAVDLYLVPAAASREALVRQHRVPPEKTRVLPLGVEDPPAGDPRVIADLRERTASGPETVVIGVVGSLIERKGHRFLFEALGALLRDSALPDIRLWVIGDGEERTSLVARAASMGLSGIVRFLGARDDAPSIMRALDVLVVPSLVETTPFVVLEAMAAGKAVVASRIYGIPEMLDEGRTGFLVPPGDAAALAASLGRLLRDPSLRAAMGRAGRVRYEERYTAERMARATERAYLGAVEEEAAA